MKTNQHTTEHTISTTEGKTMKTNQHTTEHTISTTEGKTMKNTIRKNLPTALTLGTAGVIASAAPAHAIDGTPTQPPGFDFTNTLVGWALYIAAFVLFIYFIMGIVTAARARRNGDEVTAPLWPLLGGAALTIAGLVWQSVVGI